MRHESPPCSQASSAIIATVSLARQTGDLDHQDTWLVVQADDPATVPPGSGRPDAGPWSPPTRASIRA
jgi:hypothetical protein